LDTYGPGWKECGSDCCDTNLGEKCKGLVILECMKKGKCKSGQTECKESGWGWRICCDNNEETPLDLDSDGKCDLCVPKKQPCIDDGGIFCQGWGGTPYAKSTVCCKSGETCFWHPDGAPYCF